MTNGEESPSANNQTKKQPDYTKSAVSITNDPSVEPLLANRRLLQSEINALAVQLKEAPGYQVYIESQRRLAELDQAIRDAIEKVGGYQDIAAGLYALLQRRVTITYNPGTIRDCIPNYAEAVIEEVVNVAKIKGLLKGGLISEEKVKPAERTSESIRFVLQT